MVIYCSMIKHFTFTNPYNIPGTVFLLLLSRFSSVQFSRSVVSDSLRCSLPGSAVPGILQARTLEWVAISFSNA